MSNDIIQSTKREMCIAEIAYHLRAIREAYRFYYPDGKYLSAAIVDGNIMFNNDYGIGHDDFAFPLHHRITEDTDELYSYMSEQKGIEQ